MSPVVGLQNTICTEVLYCRLQTPALINLLVLPVCLIIPSVIFVTVTLSSSQMSLEANHGSGIHVFGGTNQTYHTAPESTQ